MYQILLRRFQTNENQTLGNLLIFDEKGELKGSWQTLELPWKDNQRRVSCIPEGTYPIRFEFSPAFHMKLWELKSVPKRAEIKIHPGNFTRQIEGCILIGQKHVHIDRDEIMDIASSRDALSEFHEAMEGETEARITVMNTYL